MKFIRATIVINRSGTDRISIGTDAPFPYAYNPHCERLSLDFAATAGTGSTYVQEHFPGVPIDIVDAKTGKVTSIPEDKS